MTASSLRKKKNQFVEEISSLHAYESHSFFPKAISVVHKSKVGVCLFACMRVSVCVCMLERTYGKLAFVQFIRNSADRDLQ